MLGLAPGFNPNIGADTYGMDWENLINGLPTGVYHAVVHEVFTHSYNDLSGYPDAPARPTHYYPYTADYPFTISVD